VKRFGPTELEELRAQWTDKFVRANPAQPELARFGQTVGRVVTVTWNGRALIDFQDGAWYDIPATPEHLVTVDPAEGQAAYKGNVNSAQRFPERQG
jgi:hypothetical protein